MRGDARLPSQARPVSRSPLRVAVLGAGTVGGAVLDGLTHHPERLATDDGRPIMLTAVAVRDLDKARGKGFPAGLLTDAPAHLIADPDTDVIVELMGGIEPARTLITAALGAGKPVVTANKSVIAHHGPELESAARRSGAAFRFEAAVAGGIPVLGPLAADLAGNEIVRVRGIVNGTTNYILTSMAEDGRPYDEVLADAQELGYAEADPAGDVEGDDAVNKLVILARLAFGRWLDPSTVGRRPPTARGMGRPGITGVTEQELEGAAALGLTIKLLASTARRDGAIEAAVDPDRRPGRQPVRLDGRRHQSHRGRGHAARHGRSRRSRRRRSRDEQRGPRRPGGGRARAGFHLGWAVSGHGRRGPGGRPPRRAAPLVRVSWAPSAPPTESCRPRSVERRRSTSTTARRSGLMS